MIERISQKIMDVLEADSRLLLGGNAYAAGWTATTREENGGVPVAGKINLFDKSYDADATTHRPAIYVGSRAVEAVDSLDYETCSSAGHIEYRVLILPLIVCCMAATKRIAAQQRNQLRRNIKIILLGSIVQGGYWYDLSVPGRLGGGALNEHVNTTASGGNNQQVSEAIAVIPVQVRYSFNATAYA